jgi:hypothetical protein
MRCLVPIAQEVSYYSRSLFCWTQKHNLCGHSRPWLHTCMVGQVITCCMGGQVIICIYGTWEDRWSHAYIEHGRTGDHMHTWNMGEQVIMNCRNLFLDIWIRDAHPSALVVQTTRSSSVDSDNARWTYGAETDRMHAFNWIWSCLMPAHLPRNTAVIMLFGNFFVRQRC